MEMANWQKPRFEVGGGGVVGSWLFFLVFLFFLSKCLGL